MFIKKLYTHSKLGCLAFLTFVTAFFYINYKWGIVASPIYQLGMFSGVTHKTDTQFIYTIYVNDKPLILNDFPFVDNDMLLVSLQRFENEAKNNRRVVEVFDRIFSGVLNQKMQQTLFINNTTALEFTIWFKHYLEKTGVPVHKLSVYSNKYVWNKHKLKPVGSYEIKRFIINNQ